MNTNFLATIEDEQWLLAVHEKRIPFASGDKLPVRLRIETEKDEQGNPIEGSSRYYVEKVTGDVIRPVKVEQFEL